jgi:hypothetical protein
MIVHLVLFKLKPGIEANDARLARLAAEMDALRGKIPQVRDWEHGPNRTRDADAWDYGLRATFESEADLYQYFEHPAHQPVLEAWNEIASLAFADFRA